MQDDPAFNAYTLHRTDKPSEIYPFAPGQGHGRHGRALPRAPAHRRRSLAARLQQVVRQFVVHHDGCPDSRTCFQVLHNERGLSVHFLIDNDGTIYQTLDLVDCAFQAAGVNEISVGVELANRGDAMRFPNDYHGQARQADLHASTAINSSPTPTRRTQLESMIAVGKTLARLFPNLPQSYPARRRAASRCGPRIADPREYTGLARPLSRDPSEVGSRAHSTSRSSSAKIRGRMVFPVCHRRASKPDVPEDHGQGRATSPSAFYDNNETRGRRAATIPVGPFGQSRLWHGGMHLRADKGTPVYAPFAGKIVAARMTDDGPIGSRNFVLIRSELPVGSAALRFWTLLFHLDEEFAGPSAPAWFARASSQLADDPVPLAIDVNAGDLVGHVGEAGLPGRTRGAAPRRDHERRRDRREGRARILDHRRGRGHGPLLRGARHRRQIDKPSNGKKDGLLSRAEMMNFFKRDPQREAFRKLRRASRQRVGRQQRLGDRAQPHARLRRAAEAAARAAVSRSDRAGTCGGPTRSAPPPELPSDKLVWNYHPVTFIVWLHDKLRGAQSTSKDIAGESAFAGVAAPSNIKDDSDATEGFTDDEDVLFGDAGKKLELEDLAKGYPDDKDKK